ncbi:alpha/beta hydrolase [Sphingomonas glaciei]|uniref:Lysophospholipase n=1 Tax=Sphingomonas glaciei TaxID=2938948 RepID=A0ABY5MRT5_9SPHN|nr:alpha/beta fold hydrolase [Sphingomonas glaciei]UUR07195.1 lysophospholipase [Sphingomonas glaciei]
MMLSLLLAATLAAAPPAATELKAGPADALAGTLLKPVGKSRAAMIIIPGSGPTDRDGNSPAGIKAAPYRKLAEALAERGVATVRIDKRGMFGSAAAGNPNEATFSAYDADTRAWVESARKATGQRCVWVAGHSEGGLVAMRAANAPDVCGAVLLTTPGEKLGDTIRKQLRANPALAPYLPPAERALGELEAGRKVSIDGILPALGQSLFNPAVQGFMIELLAQDPSKLAAAIKRPLLIVQGGHDVQVGLANGDVLKKAAPRASYALFPAMNHVLSDAPAERAANLATYAEADRPLTAGLADRVAAFVTGAK